jgi:hypothetical protein
MASNIMDRQTVSEGQSALALVHSFERARAENTVFRNIDLVNIAEDE